MKEVIRDLEAMGAPADVIAEMQDRERGTDFEVWPENWPHVEMFLRLETQWRSTFGGLIGLDYGAARWVFEVYGVKDARASLDALMVMERAALVAMKEGQDT